MQCAGDGIDMISNAIDYGGQNNAYMGNGAEVYTPINAISLAPAMSSGESWNGYYQDTTGSFSMSGSATSVNAYANPSAALYVGETYAATTSCDLSGPTDPSISNTMFTTAYNDFF